MLWLPISLNIFEGSNEIGLYRTKCRRQHNIKNIMYSLNLLHVSAGLYDHQHAVVQIQNKKKRINMIFWRLGYYLK